MIVFEMWSPCWEIGYSVPISPLVTAPISFPWPLEPPLASCSLSLGAFSRAVLLGLLSGTDVAFPPAKIDSFVSAVYSHLGRVFQLPSFP